MDFTYQPVERYRAIMALLFSWPAGDSNPQPVGTRNIVHESYALPTELMGAGKRALMKKSISFYLQE